MDENEIRQQQELGWGILVCLIFYFILFGYTGCHVYVGYFFHYIVLSGVQAYNNNTALWNALAVFGFVRAGMLVPWTGTIEMVVRLHWRLIVVFPLVVLKCSLSFIYNIGHSYFSMFAPNGFIPNPRREISEPPLRWCEEEDIQHDECLDA
jgi:hypothetical protein